MECSTQKAWNGQNEILQKGLSPFQILCENKITKALKNLSCSIEDRAVQGNKEPYIKAKISGTDFTLWIYIDSIELSSSEETVFSLEVWDALTPQELIDRAVVQTITALSKKG